MTIEDAMFEFYDGVQVQGPGSETTTKQLIGLIPENRSIKQAIDIGCGTGRTSLVLSKAGINVTALDIHQPFLDYLDAKAQKANLNRNIETVKMSMSEITLPEKSFDLVWSEASAYVIGFEKALNVWKKLLKPNGHMVVTDCCWSVPSPHAEVANFWAQEYPDMLTIDQVKNIIKRNGFDLVQVKILPESDWENYYEPLKQRIEKYENDNRPEIQEVIKQTCVEISMRKKYPTEYSFAAFVMRLPEQL